VTGLPVGFRLVVDRRTRVYDDGRLVVGGSPRRALVLSDRGARVVRDLLAGNPVVDDVSAALARRLVDAGAAHPAPPRDVEIEYDVVIPTYDALDLDRSIEALDGCAAVVVVDDASTDADDVAEVASAFGAKLVRREHNGGPGSARNTGAGVTSAATIVFVDSDAVVSPGTLRSLVAHHRDPKVGAVAPRVRPAASGSSVLARFAAARSPLDLGPRTANVRPGGRIGYVPSTVLVVDRAAYDAVGGFDESLRFGEDVDLVWRLVAAGWTVRYEPEFVVHHQEPTTWLAWLARRMRYGTAAGPLSRRHPDAPLQPTLAVRRLRRSDAMRRPGVLWDTATGVLRASTGSARWVTQLWLPLLVAATPRRSRGRVLAVVVVGPALVEWLRLRPALDPARWVVASLADDVAYGLGVWRGCIAARTWRPLLFRVVLPERSPS
jgi:mycofactocin system glycosyltransferase